MYLWKLKTEKLHVGPSSTSIHNSFSIYFHGSWHRSPGVKSWLLLAKALQDCCTYRA